MIGSRSGNWQVGPADRDNQIDSNTGTVRLKAVFQNEQNELYPNQFVNARLLVEVRRGRLPSGAGHSTGPQGTFVYVVKPTRPPRYAHHRG